MFDKVYFLTLPFGLQSIKQNFPSLSSRTRKGESLGPGLVSVSDSDSKFRDAQESDSVSDSSLRFVHCLYQNGDIEYSFLKEKRENRNQKYRESHLKTRLRLTS